MRYSLGLRIPILLTVVCAGLTLLAAGCAPDQRKAQLAEGYAALEANQFDEAMRQADAYLAKHPSGPGTAEALYLRGRGYEQRNKANLNEARTNLQAARAAYIEALSQQPSPQLELYIRTSLANVAYFQDDYATALKEWATVYPNHQDREIRMWVLYRIGLCQQRLGRFADADKTYTQVEQEYGGTLPAQRAKEKRGARGFMVQFATFLSSATADNAISTLRSQGVMAGKQTDSRGRSVVVAGPLPTFQQAMAIRAAHLDKYPDAMILP
jgi:tetratricopeptide (TPR) repeat protein